MCIGIADHFEGQRKRAVWAGCPTDADSEAALSVGVVEQMGSLVPEVSSDRSSSLLVYSARVKGYELSMSLLVDSGASQNFVSLAALEKSPSSWKLLRESGRKQKTTVRLANGTLVAAEGVRVELTFSFNDFNCRDWFVVLKMQNHHDLILGMPWLAKYQPWIDWRSRTIASSTQDTGKEMYLREAYAMDAIAVAQVGCADWKSCVTKEGSRGRCRP